MKSIQFLFSLMKKKKMSDNHDYNRKLLQNRLEGLEVHCWPPGGGEISIVQLRKTKKKS